MNERIRDRLTFVYGPAAAQVILPRLAALLETYRARLQSQPRAAYAADSRAADEPVAHQPFDHRDTILITYGDAIQAEGERPLRTLRAFLERRVGGLIRGVHLLPFYPYSSDDGFSVIDYNQVDPALGDWGDIEAFGRDFRLMFDAVINHISQHSDWFQAFLRGQAPYTDYFITVAPEADLSAVFRPRALPLLTPVITAGGPRHVWTTFSADQIDLNYASPNLLLEVLRVLLNYVAHGAAIIRLDAIAFLWKEPGTTCLHLPQTHAIIQLIRAVLDEVAPQVALVTETNVPHQENISYFGDGHDEAQMVYNFPLPPLTLHAFHSGDATLLSQWAATLTLPSDQVAFFNFLASHDGIGLMPARGILSHAAIETLAARTEALGGFVSYKSNSDGSQSAYELNINYMDALGEPAVIEPDAVCAQRFLAAQAIMLALRGVPGIYFHSLFGSRSWRAGVEQTGQKRAINRQRLERDRLAVELQQGLRQMVFEGYCRLLRARTTEPAFYPYGQQQILELHPAVFALLREYDGQSVLCLQNVSSRPVTVTLPFRGLDLLAQRAIDKRQYQLPPYGVLWSKRY